MWNCEQGFGDRNSGTKNWGTWNREELGQGTAGGKCGGMELGKGNWKKGTGEMWLGDRAAERN